MTVGDCASVKTAASLKISRGPGAPSLTTKPQKLRSTSTEPINRRHMGLASKSFCCPPVQSATAVLYGDIQHSRLLSFYPCRVESAQEHLFSATQWQISKKEKKAKTRHSQPVTSHALKNTCYPSLDDGVCSWLIGETVERFAAFWWKSLLLIQISPCGFCYSLSNLQSRKGGM